MNVIIIEFQYITLDSENSIVFITLYNDEIIRHDIFDVKMNEKHKWNDNIDQLKHQIHF